ncbi:FkbM family methyltransferase [Methylovulum miyakonense]|uniref:FkbM family methyltransferase n=1 Tax=Methylovulum miyakonense TaxID=645578 RepID=UPI0003682A6D|nr:FkbM family methyltransferase [Methylovulum miyakonense]
MISINTQKKIIKNTFRRFGLEINRYAPESSQAAQITSILRKFEIDLVFDIGANEGQFASEIRSGGYAGNIVSFEPLSNAYVVLQQTSARDTKWVVYPRCALGAHNDEIEINISGNSVSSSLLTMLDSHISAAPHSTYIGRESVPLLTLDSMAFGFTEKFKNPFLKIDTQGFEWEVLNGAQNVLPHMRGILLELSLVPLYEGQHLWQEMMERLIAEGFDLWAIQPGFTDPHNGRTLQVDGIFIRK